ncbi:MAG: hypothetical protein IPL84_02065 [Chitinophagaceae bacterium]|nr:hypothetical protein [Chitinophagaceae bacterium]
MQQNTPIFESLFNRKLSEPDTVEFLKRVTADYPYFSPAQFYLLQQSKSDSVDFEKQALKTNLLFNSPHWLHFQLATVDKEEQFNETEPVQPVEAVMPENIIDPPAVAENFDGVEEPGDVEVEQVALPADNGAFADENKQAEPLVEIAPVSIVESALQMADESPDDTDLPEQTEPGLEPMHIELKMPEQKNNLHEAMLFEPMHVVDYFASQGIKLSEDVQAGDKLGKQLKSFTEWLKTMKKVHEADASVPAAETDENIQTLAENSNTEAEVITESMAEVFARQGKLSKARELYQKLSLLNPAKSTYFAAKIENLKGI